MTQTFGRTLRKAQRGDGRAFADLFTAYAPRIRTFVSARGVADPDGTTNEVFLRAHRALADFRGSESAFVGWLFQIARNLVIDEFRSSTRQLDLVPLEQAPEPSHHAVDEWADHEGEAAAVARLLERLTPIQREIVTLRSIVGLSYDEIARATGMRTVSARSTYKRARRRLAELVSAEGLLDASLPTD